MEDLDANCSPNYPISVGNGHRALERAVSIAKMKTIPFWGCREKFYN